MHASGTGRVKEKQTPSGKAALCFKSVRGFVRGDGGGPRVKRSPGVLFDGAPPLGCPVAPLGARLRPWAPRCAPRAPCRAPWVIVAPLCPQGCSPGPLPSPLGACCAPGPFTANTRSVWGVLGRWPESGAPATSPHAPAAGIEPATFGLEGRRLVHYAKGACGIAGRAASHLERGST